MPNPDAVTAQSLPARWTVHIQADDFDLSDEVAQLRQSDASIGAVACFIGTVRDVQTRSMATDGTAAEAPMRLSALELEHYPGMTEKAIAAMLDEARRRFDLVAARVVHRVGLLKPSDQIVLVATAAAHRHAALDACSFLMDWLKTDAPFWKKAHGDQAAQWVAARAADDAALARWGLRSANASSAPGSGSVTAPDPGAAG